MFLIYPYWNVKENMRVQKHFGAEVSNLSILECKELFSSFFYVLTGMFLIYPYWNVKNLFFQYLFFYYYVSNLSILECKETQFTHS